MSDVSWYLLTLLARRSLAPQLLLLVVPGQNKSVNVACWLLLLKMLLQAQLQDRFIVRTEADERAELLGLRHISGCSVLRLVVTG